MLSFHKYTRAIDIWSVGCILAEMLGRRFLFPGKNFLNQIELILKLLGTPSDEVQERVGGELASRYLRSLPKTEPTPMKTLFCDAR
jgi:mitogen-activated protein kinase 7